MNHRVRPIQVIFELLPTEFTKTDIERLMKRHGRNQFSCNEFIRRHKLLGLIRPLTNNLYTKVAV